MKSTSQTPIEQHGKYSYSLKAKNYNELRSTHTGASQLLIVLFLPSDVESWLVHSEECLVARRCAYWLSLRGAPEIDQDSRTVYIPRANQLSVLALRALMTRFSKLEVLNYGG